jgi:hypothetical protein
MQRIAWVALVEDHLVAAESSDDHQAGQGAQPIASYVRIEGAPAEAVDRELLTGQWAWAPSS